MILYFFLAMFVQTTNISLIGGFAWLFEVNGRRSNFPGQTRNHPNSLHEHDKP